MLSYQKLIWIYSRKDSLATSLRKDSRSGSIGNKDQLRRIDSRGDFYPIPEDSNSNIENISAPRRPSLYRSVRLVILGNFVLITSFSFGFSSNTHLKILYVFFASPEV